MILDTAGTYVLEVSGSRFDVRGYQHHHRGRPGHRRGTDLRAGTADIRAVAGTSFGFAVEGEDQFGNPNTALTGPVTVASRQQPGLARLDLSGTLTRDRQSRAWRSSVACRSTWSASVTRSW